MTLHQQDVARDSVACYTDAHAVRSSCNWPTIRAVAAQSSLSTNAGQAYTLDHDGHVRQYVFGVEPAPFVAFRRKVASFPNVEHGETEPVLAVLSFPWATGFALALGQTVYVWLHQHRAASPDSPTETKRLCLEDHSSPVIGICTIESLVVTLSADHSFKLWDVGNGSSAASSFKCIYHSEIFSASASPTFLAMDDGTRLCIGSSDGTVRVVQVKRVPTAPLVQVQTLFSLPIGNWISESVHCAHEQAERDGSTVCISAKGGQARRVLAREDSGISMDAPAISHAVLTAYAAQGRVYAITASHLVVCCLGRQVPLLVHDFRNPLGGGEGVTVLGLLRSAQSQSGRCDGVESAALFSVIPLVRKSSTQFVLLQVAETLSADDATHSLEAAFVELSLNHLISHATPLSHVLLDAVSIHHHGRGNVTTNPRIVSPGKWLRSIADTALAQLESAHIVTLGDLLLNRALWSGPQPTLALPLGVPKVLDALLALLPKSSTKPSILPLNVQEFADDDDLNPSSPLHKHSWTQRPPPAKSKLDKPITFRSTVKSSGYSRAPSVSKRLLAARKASKSGVPLASAPASKSTSAPSSSERWIGSHAHNESWAPSLVSSYPAWLSGQISCVSSSPQTGRFLLVGGADGTGHIVRSKSFLSSGSLPDSSPSILSSNRIKGTTKSSSWSHDDRTVILCSSNVVRVWEPRAIGQDPTGPGTEDPSVDLPDLMPGSVTSAQFVHKSRLALVAHGDRIELFKYQLSDKAQKPAQKANHLRSTFTSTDLKPRLPSGRAKSVWHLPAPNGAQQVTAVASWNNRGIPHAVFATSDKSLCVVDMNQGALAARVSTDLFPGTFPRIAPAGHSIVAGGGPPSRPVHSIVTWDPAGPTTPAHYSPHLFLTTAHADTVRVWDMRTMTPVVRFASHLPCARHLRDAGTTGAVLAPCGTLVALATDMPGQAVVLFDVRKAASAVVNPVGSFTVMRTQVNMNNKHVDTHGRPSRVPSRPVSAGAPRGVEAGKSGAVVDSRGGEGGPRCATMGGELVGGMAFHAERAVLVVGTTRGGILSYRMR